MSPKQRASSRTPRAPVLISNLEVAQCLKTKKKDSATKIRKRSMQDKDWIEDQVAQYLDGTRCHAVTKQTELMDILRSKKRSTSSSQRTGFGLTEAESLQVINSVPREPVEIHLLVEDLQTRMTERQQDDLLRVIKSFTTTEADNK